MENSKFARANRETEASTEGVVYFAAFRNKKAVSSIVQALQILKAAELSVEADCSVPSGSKNINGPTGVSKTTLMTVECRDNRLRDRMFAITEDNFYLKCGNL